MKFHSFITLALSALASLGSSTPVEHLEPRELDLAGNVAAILQGVGAAVTQGDPVGVIAALRNVTALVSVPGSPQEAIEKLEAIFNGTATPPANLYQYIANLRALDLVDSLESLFGFVNGAADGRASTNNNNAAAPDTIYPQKLSCDAPYSVSEDVLRSAIYIPSTFTHGIIPPVILFPGTGNFGYETFAGNFIPLLTGSDFADPVWVNVPGRLLNDAQKNAEFAAYAINYIASITKKNVTMLAWSQGNIDTQWAFKYWPSTTLVTSDHVAISPDYAGTVVANFVALSGASFPPSVLQQEYLGSSNFITTLRSCDGDSGYVPTTTIYSGLFDEIVEPQQGDGASAFLKDVRGVGVTNNQVQLVCPAQPAGSFYTHEGVLYNPIAYYLLRDAMANPGPGRVNRLPSGACATYLTPGLDIGDFLVTENAVAIAGFAILAYPNPVAQEPAISAYASTCPTSSCLSSTTSTSTTAISVTSTIFISTSSGTLTTTTGTASTSTSALSTSTSVTITITGTAGTSTGTTGTPSGATGTTTSTTSTLTGKGSATKGSSSSSSTFTASSRTGKPISTTLSSTSTWTNSYTDWSGWHNTASVSSFQPTPSKPQTWVAMTYSTRSSHVPDSYNNPSGPDSVAKTSDKPVAGVGWSSLWSTVPLGSDKEWSTIAPLKPATTHLNGLGWSTIPDNIKPTVKTSDLPTWAAVPTTITQTVKPSDLPTWSTLLDSLTPTAVATESWTALPKTTGGVGSGGNARSTAELVGVYRGAAARLNVTGFLSAMSGVIGTLMVLWMI